MKIVMSQTMQEMDKRAMEEFGIPGLVLMENAGRCCASSASRREPLPSAIAPHALPIATCGRSRLAPSSRCRVSRCPPASSTTTVSGAAEILRPAARAPFTRLTATFKLRTFIQRSSCC